MPSPRPGTPFHCFGVSPKAVDTVPGDPVVVRRSLRWSRRRTRCRLRSRGSEALRMKSDLPKCSSVTAPPTTSSIFADRQQRLAVRAAHPWRREQASPRRQRQRFHRGRRERHGSRRFSSARHPRRRGHAIGEPGTSGAARKPRSRPWRPVKLTPGEGTGRERARDEYARRNFPPYGVENPPPRW